MASLSSTMQLTLVAPTGANPGALRMLTHVPPGLPPGAPLVVVLHGCTQNAAAYDHGAGWSILAQRHGFALLFPEQQRSNNANLCFNWFQPGDVTRGQGEVESIRQMVLQMLATHGLDRRRVFVTGLSAGGAMTSAMLATAPEMFAGGAIIAGLPYGAAADVQHAMGAMRAPPVRSARAWGDLVRAASGHRGAWPAVQVWHGDADGVVSPGNAQALLAQWGDVLGVSGPAQRTTLDAGVRHDVWLGTDGRAAMEFWLMPGFGHGTPVAVMGTDADRTTGVPGPHMLEARVGATWELARSWGLLTQPPRPQQIASVRAMPKPAAAGPMGVVNDALRAAGLLR